VRHERTDWEAGSFDISRRTLLKTLTAGAMATALTSRDVFAGVPAPSPKPPNVLFIGVDDLRPQLNSYGCAQMKTPNFDRLAKMSVQFNHAYVQQAVCAASRASLLTGCRPDTTGIDGKISKEWGEQFLSTHPDLQTFFFNNGYYTRTLGKVHHAAQKLPSFHLTEDHYIPDARFYALPENQQEGTRKDWTRPAPAWEIADLPDEAYMDGQIARVAIETIRRATNEELPFFIAPGFLKPHLPFSCPKKYWDLYDPDDIEFAAVDSVGPDAPSYAVRHMEIGFYKEIDDPENIPRDVARKLIHGYYACVSFIDAQLGKLLDELKAQNLLDNTVIVLWTDHGWHLGDHGTWCKHSNFECATHSPIMACVPGMKTAGRQCDALIEHVDLYPTLLDFCGFDIPAYMEGISFAPLLENPQRPWKSAAFSQYPRGEDVEGYSVRTADFRYTQWQSTATGEVLGQELYDHREDPLEARNVVHLESNRETVDRLAGVLKDGWKKALPPPL
jgi:iduronate 2-sulfatase